VVTPEGRFTYGDLLEASGKVAAGLLDGRASLGEARVAFPAVPGWEYVVTQWGVWRAGGIAVPIAVSYPPPEVEYVVRDSGAVRVLRAEDVRAWTEVPAPGSRLPAVTEGGRALIVYTSGTTARPKGAVLTHGALRAQVESLAKAWGWTADDRILLVLPLHHVHGIVNVLISALWSGAVCEILPKFDAEQVWERFASRELTLFMAVPTIYQRLIAAWESAPADRQRAWAAGARALRLMVSGSAALSVQTLNRWNEITGHTLLERYGMTEIGMALSNPLRGPRRPGFVGSPLPGVEVRLVGDDGRPVAPGTPGEIEVRGPTVFLEYWNRPDATQDAFHDGWFRTGDVAVVEDGSYRILGRTTVDIIKTGGYKVSGLEIEEVLRTHPAVAECAVVGVEDADLGERVCVAVEASGTLTLDQLQSWAKERLAPYKIPRTLRIVDSLPRNVMGKVVKGEVKKLF
jgi:malonyl-CoA/methylmalonyl-CoA synthetase